MGTCFLRMYLAPGKHFQLSLLIFAFDRDNTYYERRLQLHYRSTVVLPISLTISDLLHLEAPPFTHWHPSQLINRDRL